MCKNDGVALADQLASVRRLAPPEEQLMIAVLEDAIDCLLRYRRARSNRGQQLLRDTEEWINSDQSSWLFSFRSICNTIGLDPHIIRGAVEEIE